MLKVGVVFGGKPGFESVYRLQHLFKVLLYNCVALKFINPLNKASDGLRPLADIIGQALQAGVGFDIRSATG